MKQLAMALLPALAVVACAAPDFDAGVAAYDRGDYATAAEHWEPLAEDGDPEAQYRLATLYREGTGVERDDGRAAVLLREAAVEGHRRAAYQLGLMYASGAGVPQNEAEALAWMRLAAQRGHATARIMMAVMESAEDGREIAAMPAPPRKPHPPPLRAKPSLAQSDGGAEAPEVVVEAVVADPTPTVVHANLGPTPNLAPAPAATGFEAGLDAYKRGDFATALAAWQPLAEQGLAEAQERLAVMHERGEGVSQDLHAAVLWFRRAAEQGYAPAQFSLGVMRLKGKGVPQDYVLAHMWFDLAAAQGDFAADQSREIIAIAMTPEQLKEARRLARQWRPTDPERTAGQPTSTTKR